MNAHIVTYLQKDGTRKQVLVLRDAEMIASGKLLAEQVAATDTKFAEIIGLEKLKESVVIDLC